METSTLYLLVEQVREHLKVLPVKERVRELIYNHFLPQCHQYEITEDDFYKLILKTAFKEAAPAPEEDPDPPNPKGTFVKLFGVTLHSLQRLGEVLFEDPSREKIYLEDVTFLKAHVDSLADTDLAITYTELYKAESDPERRYLKICYRLNPRLPYRLEGELFGTLAGLLAAGFASKPLLLKIYQDYKNGKLAIWLQEHEPDRVVPAVADRTMVSFLAFIYSVDAGFPFYIDQELFYSPIELIAKAQKDLGFWGKLSKYCNNGELFVWFEALGYTDWRLKLKKVADSVQHQAQLSDDEKGYAVIQQLLYLIDPEAIRPQLSASEKQIEALNLEATQLLEIPIVVNLKTIGFVQADYRLSPVQEGIWLATSQASFFDLTDQKEQIIRLLVDPQLLQKNVEYQPTLQVSSLYQTIPIPIRLKAVFPLRAFLGCLLKYSLFGAIFFGFFRWLLTLGTGQREGLAPQIITTAVGRSLPDNYAVFYGVFVALLVTFLLAIVAIRKVEKI